MILRLDLNPKLDGAIWFHSFRGAKQRLAERHNELEFNFVVHGTATYLVNQQKYILSPNTQIWLFPRHEHVLLSESNDCQMWIVVVRPRLLRRICREDAFQYLTKPSIQECCRRVSVGGGKELHSLLNNVVDTAAIPEYFNSGLAYAIHKAWLLSCDETPLRPACDVHPCVERVAQMLDRGDLQMSTEALGEASGLSVSRLRRLFNEQIGMGIHEYRNRIMVERFMQIYDGRTKKMLSAAFEAGFGSYAQFYRIFSEIIGVPPAKYYREKK
jgi:AraC-like DNA-binding protein